MEAHDSDHAETTAAQLSHGWRSMMSLKVFGREFGDFLVKMTRRREDKLGLLQQLFSG